MLKNPNSIKRLLGATLAVLACPTLGLAVTTNHETLPLLTSPTTNVTGPYTFQNIAAFNNALGTLIAVDFTLTLYSTSYVTVFNTDMKPEQYMSAQSRTSASTTLTYNTDSGPGTLVVDSGTTKSGPFSGTVAANSVTPEMLGATTSKSSSFTIDNPGSFYSGNSTKTYDLLTNFKENKGVFGGVVTSGDPGVYFGGGDNLYETLSVEYFYCDCGSVPEPSSLPLLGLSLAGLFLGRRFILKRARVA